MHVYDYFLVYIKKLTMIKVKKKVFGQVFKVIEFKNSVYLLINLCYIICVLLLFNIFLPSMRLFLLLTRNFFILFLLISLLTSL